MTLIDRRMRRWIDVAMIAALAACGRGGGDKAVPSSKPKEDMVLVQGGSFRLRDRAANLSVAAFRIDRTEVTRGDYEACVAAKACAALPEPPPGRAVASARHPVVDVTPAEAAAYCAWLDKTLPTEAQWEIAARGLDSNRTYPWGEAMPDCDRAMFERWTGDRSEACGEADPHTATHAVGSHPSGASPSGALDMAGNVLEWTKDKEGPYAIAKGGRMLGAEDQLRITYRKLVLQQAGTPARDRLVGFRCVASTSPPAPSP